MPRHAGAAIVGIASWWGRSGHAYYAAYCTSKAGVISLVQCLAAELAPEGIRANAVSPGNIDTQMHRSALESEAAERGVSFEEMKAIEWAKIPLGIAGPPQSIADAVLFLSSDKSSYITGATLDVNGGVQFN
jgi:NAD(P)-dependent dehydrogenase (short-subunit alcohol dehydrogenase family)